MKIAVPFFYKEWLILLFVRGCWMTVKAIHFEDDSLLI